MKIKTTPKKNSSLGNDPSVNCYVELVLWTASMECVARPVVERLDPAGKVFQHRVYRDRRWYKETGYTKDLRRLGRDMNLCAIVENSPASVALNRRNSIIVRDFVTGQDHDLLVVKEVLDAWVRCVGKTFAEDPSNDKSKWSPAMTSPATIVNFLHSHPAITPSNEVAPRARPSNVQGMGNNSSVPHGASTGTFGKNIFVPRTGTLGVTVSRFAVNRPSMHPYARR